MICKHALMKAEVSTKWTQRGTGIALASRLLTPPLSETTAWTLGWAHAALRDGGGGGQPILPLPVLLQCHCLLVPTSHSFINQFLIWIALPSPVLQWDWPGSCPHRCLLAAALLSLPACIYSVAWIWLCQSPSQPLSVSVLLRALWWVSASFFLGQDTKL